MKLLIGYDGSEYSDVAINDLRHAGLPPIVDAVVLTAVDVWAGLLEERDLDVDAGSRVAVERFIGRAPDKRLRRRMPSLGAVRMNCRASSRNGSSPQMPSQTRRTGRC